MAGSIQLQAVKNFIATTNRITIPGDKSISHRSVMFGSLAKGETVINRPLLGEDVRCTIDCFRQMGVPIEITNDQVRVQGGGWDCLRAPEKALYCGNSGTTMRLMMGILAGRPFVSQLIGDASLSRRPMARVADPLSQMGAQIGLTDDRPPVRISPGDLAPIQVELKVASAQVKSAIILAALQTKGSTTINGLIESRDHTERMIPHFGGSLEVSNQQIVVEGPQSLVANSIDVPSDVSSAAFWLVGALMVPNGRFDMSGVSLNPTRTGIVDVLKRMGADIQIELHTEDPEPVGKITLQQGAELRGVEISGSDIPRLVDELPMIAVLATQVKGLTRVRDAAELRVKESDRIEVVAENLRKIGIEIHTFDDGFEVMGPQKIRGGADIETHLDHRIAMAFSIASTIAENPIRILDIECVQTSYPDFYKSLEEVTQ